MEKLNYSVTKNGKKLSKKLYTIDLENRIFATKESGLVIDFSDINNFTFKTGWNCTFKTGSDCTFDTCGDCTFKTGWNCTFKTGWNCTFKTGWNCTFKTGSGCTLTRRDIFEFYNISDKEIQLAPYDIKGYVENGFYYVDGKKEYPAIIADGILSEVLSKKGNVYKVKNYGEDDISYLIKDGDIYSHGKTIKDARESLIYKISNRNTSIYDNYTIDTIVSFEEAIKMYRVITGACEAGTKYFVDQNKDKIKEKYTIKEIIELTTGQYNHSKLVEFFNK